ncbi:hypothetical protein [Lichenicoccus sp.]|uniref:hypothetical protein n=1 Tax=Lichenicoccus sp. TaxID=2781899 RepID=UPI003D0AD0BF
MLFENDTAAVTGGDDDASPVTGTGLARAAMRTLEDTFAAREHRPGPDHRAALLHILETFEAMADGTAAAKVFLASLDPGIGKSSSVVAFSKALAESAEHRNVGMLVCVGRLDEARALLEDLTAAGLGGRVATRTSNEELNALSGCPAPEAQILVVTQQKVELETRHRPFQAASVFHYQGHARAVRVWDEAWLPGAPITLDRAELGHLFVVASRLNSRLYAALEDFFVDLKSVPDGELIRVPDWTTLSGVEESEVLAGLERGRGVVADQQRLLASALFFVAGRQIRVTRERYTERGEGRVLISYQDTLPEDLAPLVVLDASIRVRQTYEDAMACRGVVALRSAVKDYSPLTVHLWKTAGSKTAFRSKGGELVDGMAAAILSRPTERWLVVTHKKGPKVGDVAGQLVKRLPADVAKLVDVITWGTHMATNTYREVGNVILGGTLFMPACHYLALTHMAKARPTDLHDFASQEEVLKTTHGEHRNLILQAACRGRVRQSNGDQCLPMDLYLIASAASAIPSTSNMQTIFPGAAVKRWCPVAPKLAGKALAASLVLDRLLADGALATADGFLTYGQIASVMPGKDGAVKPMAVRDFKQRIADSDQWRDHVAALGLIEDFRGVGQRHPAKGLRLSAVDELPDWQDAAD